MSDKELILKYVSKDMQEEALKKLETGYPVQYILGNVEFYNQIINVNEDVLIPRFETEYLIDYLVKRLNKFNNLNILDIGTGSGCISISLKNNLDCKVTAIDISNKAIETAKENAINNHADINFINSSIEDYTTLDKYDVIVSNPPYVPYDGIIDDKIKYEPEIAIFAKDNGLYFYKVILEKIKDMLNDKYLIAFEIGYNQFNDINKIINNYLPNSKVTLLKDLNNYERFIIIENE